jgi:hypothetical protein
MAEAANFTVVQDGDVTLADPVTGDIDHQYGTFGAPGLSSSTALADRPVLLLKLNPAADDAALEVTLNGKIIYTQTFSAGRIRSLNEVLTHGDLLAAGNVLSIANRGSGPFTVSDIMFEYKVEV